MDVSLGGCFLLVTDLPAELHPDGHREMELSLPSAGAVAVLGASVFCLPVKLPEQDACGEGSEAGTACGLQGEPAWAEPCQVWQPGHRRAGAAPGSIPLSLPETPGAEREDHPDSVRPGPRCAVV